MNKMKKIIFGAIIGLISILGIYTNAIAYNVGQEINISFAEYSSNDDIYCVEHGQSLKANNSYKIISQVRIEGNKSTDHEGNTQISSANSRLAYILSQDNGGDKKNGPVTNAVWNYIYTWMSIVGRHHAGLYSGFASATPGNSTWLDEDAADYADELGDITSITDNTKKGNIKVLVYQKDGKSYIRVGPFNWTFSGDMKGITVRDQNRNPISGVLCSRFNGNNEYWFGANEITSGSDFYISIPMDTNISKITTITGYASAPVKGVNIWFLESKEGYKQNLIIREPYDTTVDIETTFDYDIPIRGSLKVVKVNKDNTTVKLPGVGFYIQHKETGKYIYRDNSGKITYVTERANATEFVTDQKGEILIRDLIVGTYIAYETKNPNYGYEMISEGKEKTIVVDKTEELEIGNKQVYVKLSGYVWVDKIAGKTSDRNDLYKDSNNDPYDVLLDGIKVRLKDRRTGEIVQETITANGGAYLFNDVLIEKLRDYYVEFEYDGLTYTNVVPHIDRDNGSKSAEGEQVRNAFNQNFTVVEGESRNTGYTRDANGNRKHNLLYHINEAEHEATLINNGQYIITANTDVPNYIIRDHFTYGQIEIKYINLGLYEREKIDLAVVKDLQNVRLTINGYEHTYIYAQRFLNAGEYGDGFNVGVKFGSKYGSMSYSRAIYKSDYEYVNEKDKSKELKVYITYQIGIRNQSSNLIAKINNMVDYYDSKYQIVNVGTSLDEKGNVVGNISHTESAYNDAYTKTIINNATIVNAQQQANIYVQFALNREAIVNILNNGENLKNVVEINSYSIYDGNKIYAAIDVDSNPGNCVPGDTRTYEDDTDSSPALKLEVADQREMTGKVFLDETSGELMTGKIRQGSGAYEEGEPGIEGVELTLTENTGSGKVYTAKTNVNGDFLISNYIPGDYTLTYTWGDQKYTVQSYKGTVYDSTRDQSNKKWYKENVGIRLTDAIDDYATRLKIDEELKNITSGTKTTIDKMNSTTPTMGIGVEYETTYTASMGDRYVYRIENVDFGIVERPRQDLALSKRVKTLKATLTGGTDIVNLTIDENGNITGDRNSVAYMGPSIDDNGFVKLELDNEVIQGCIIEVGYEIKATNQSELDYLSEKFYKYGVVEGNVVVVEPIAIIDYLDNKWAFDSDKNPQWKIKTVDELKTLVAEQVYSNTESTVGDKTILHTDSLKGQKLQPMQSSQVVLLNVAKTLATTDEIALDNETEIIELSKTGGSMPQSIPGNYIPGKGHTETDDDMAETTIVTPNTGDNQNYLIPIVIGTIALIMLGVGVIIIKKRVL